MYVYMYVCVYIDRWMDGRVNGWMDGYTKIDKQTDTYIRYVDIYV